MNNEADLIIKLSTSSASLATAPGDQDNWIERAGTGGHGGELPAYIRKIARAVMKSGKSKSAAIAIAISRIKRWAHGGENVQAGTRAKAAKALAEWESLKLKNKAHKVVGLSSPGGSYFAVSNTDFDTRLIGRAWGAMRDQALGMDRDQDVPEGHSDSFPYILELWNTFIVVEAPRVGQLPRLMKIPYVCTGTEVHFGPAVEVKAEFVAVASELTENEEVLLAGLVSSKED